MSVIRIQSSIYSTGPSFHYDGNRLVARTRWWHQLLTLWGYSRRLIVDKQTGWFDLSVRRFWFFKTHHTLRFNRITHVDFEFGSIATAVDHRGRAMDSLERFSVTVVLDTGERLDLFGFAGDGANMRGVSGLMLGDSLVDYEGTQEDDSRAFVRSLCDAGAFSLGPKLEVHRDEQGRRIRCTTCHKPNPPRRKNCQYCGGTLVVGRS